MNLDIRNFEFVEVKNLLDALQIAVELHEEDLASNIRGVALNLTAQYFEDSNSLPFKHIDNNQVSRP